MLTTCYLRVDLFVLRCQELFSALLFVLMPGLPWSFSPCLLLSPCSLDLGRLYSWLVTFLQARSLGGAARALQRVGLEPCMLHGAPKLSELPDLQKGPEGLDKGGNRVNCT